MDWSLCYSVEGRSYVRVNLCARISGFGTPKIHCMPARAPNQSVEWATFTLDLEETVTWSGAPTIQEEQPEQELKHLSSNHAASKFLHQSSQCFSTQESKKKKKGTHSKTNALPTFSPNAFSAVVSSVRRHSLSSNLRSAIPCSTSKIVSRMRTGKRSSGSSSFTPSALLWRTSLIEPNLCIVV